MNIQKIVEKSSESSIYRWLLNIILRRMIPFNQRQRLEITAIKKGLVTIRLPYKRSNQNHLKGLHACSLATLAEYTTGMTLLTCLNPDSYRIIMQRLEMDYFYQGKTSATSTYSISDDWLKSNVTDIVENNSPALVKCSTDIFDTDGNKLATGNMTWQIKAWEEVKTIV